MPVEAPQLHEVSTSEVCNVAIDFQGKLDSGELLTGTPTVTEVTTSHLTISNKQVSTVELTINCATVAIGEAVQFRVDASGATVGDTYEIHAICATDAGQTRDGVVKIIIV